MTSNFHLSLPCLSITDTRNFYQKLGASVGRRSGTWIDINFHDNQITFTKSGAFNFESKNYTFGGVVLPSFHFGIILNKGQWQDKLKMANGEEMEIQSIVDFLEGKIGQHKSFFIKDPNGYTVEFKCFNNSSEVFEK